MRPNNGSITVEKKEHTLKNTVMSLPSKFIVFLGRTFSGHNHDYKMLKQEFPPEMDWFSDLHVRVDLGYQGMQSDYQLDQLDIPYTYCLPSNDSANILSYQELPTSIQCGEAMARRRKEERRVGIASRGMVRRWGRFSSRVRHWGIADRERVPERCHSSGSAVDVCSDAPAEAQRAERTADGGVVDVSRALSVSPCAPRITAQRVARFHPYYT